MWPWALSHVSLPSSRVSADTVLHGQRVEAVIRSGASFSCPQTQGLLGPL